MITECNHTITKICPECIEKNNHEQLKSGLLRLVVDIENRAVLHRRRLEFTALETCNSIIQEAKKLLDVEGQ